MATITRNEKASKDRERVRDAKEREFGVKRDGTRKGWEGTVRQTVEKRTNGMEANEAHTRQRAVAAG